jgi:hypothetical protein
MYRVFGCTVGTSSESAAPLAEKNAAARHYALRSLMSLHNEHRVYYVSERIKGKVYMLGKSQGSM